MEQATVPRAQLALLRLLRHLPHANHVMRALTVAATVRRLVLAALRERIREVEQAPAPRAQLAHGPPP